MKKLYNKVLEKKLTDLVKSKEVTCYVFPIPLAIDGNLFYNVTISNKRTKKEEHLYYQLREI